MIWMLFWMVWERPSNDGCRHPVFAGGGLSGESCAGHSMVNGKSIGNVCVATSREERITMRAASGSIFKDCVRYGYIMGRDERTKEKSDELLINFLNKYFSDIDTE